MPQNPSHTLNANTIEELAAFFCAKSRSSSNGMSWP